MNELEDQWQKAVRHVGLLSDGQAEALELMSIAREDSQLGKEDSSFLAAAEQQFGPKEHAFANWLEGYRWDPIGMPAAALKTVLTGFGWMIHMDWKELNDPNEALTQLDKVLGRSGGLPTTSSEHGEVHAMIAAHPDWFGGGMLSRLMAGFAMGRGRRMLWLECDDIAFFTVQPDTFDELVNTQLAGNHRYVEHGTN